MLLRSLLARQGNEEGKGGRRLGEGHGGDGGGQHARVQAGRVLLSRLCAL